VRVHSDKLNRTELNSTQLSLSCLECRKVTKIELFQLSWVELSFLFVHSDKLAMNTLSTQLSSTQPNSTGQLSWVELSLSLWTRLKSSIESVQVSARQKARQTAYLICEATKAVRNTLSWRRLCFSAGVELQDPIHSGAKQARSRSLYTAG